MEGTFRLLIVTGMSGAGKTQVMQALEDMGFFCVDNLPPVLIPKFSNLCRQASDRINQVALVVDIRGGMFLKACPTRWHHSKKCRFLMKSCSWMLPTKR